MKCTPAIQTDGQTDFIVSGYQRITSPLQDHILWKTSVFQASDSSWEVRSEHVGQLSQIWFTNPDRRRWDCHVAHMSVLGMNKWKWSNTVFVLRSTNLNVLNLLVSARGWQWLKSKFNSVFLNVEPRQSCYEKVSRLASDTLTFWNVDSFSPPSFKGPVWLSCPAPCWSTE